MNYLSTRGGSDKVQAREAVKAAEAIRLGIAPDGGLFIPDTIPQLTMLELSRWAELSYQELATEILSLYLTDYQSSDLRQMVEAAYAFPAKFDHPAVTPIKYLNGNCHLLELWHGPTCAFKDVALQLLPHLMTKAGQLANDSKELIILVATSGDTGKAALEGFKDVPGTRIIVFFPEQGVSEIQRLQMVTQEGKNTKVISVKGNFDDAQNGVKQIFGDHVLAEKLQANQMAFSSANSINWGRLVPQIVYYFSGYFQLSRQDALKFGDKLNVTVPTGNFGNILAAYFAKQMGLPINKLICASNSNNVLTDFLKTGCYDRNREFHTTVSPSMDILISSNLERLLYYISGGNSPVVQQWMAQLLTSGRYQVDNLTSHKIAKDFYSGFATEAETTFQIKKTFSETKMVIDTHTAVGTAVYEQYFRETGDTTPVLIASTASPFKFNSSVLKALGVETIGVNELSLLEKLGEVSKMKIPAGLSDLTHKIIRHQSVCEREEMDMMVEKLLEV